MSFVAVNPPPVTPEAAVKNDGWFPDIDLKSMREDMRLDGTVTAPRLRRSVINAVASVNAELADWQAMQRSAGYGDLAGVPSQAIDGKSLKVMRYMRAVAAYVQADLAEAYRDLDTLPDGAGKEARVYSKLEIRVDEFRRELRWAIADLKGQRRVIVELI